jgi:hypothetical protein
LLRSFSTKKESSHLLILPLSGGLGTNRLSPNIQKLSAHSSQNRYLDGVAATPDSHFGKRTSSTNAHGADAMMRLQNI